MEDGEASMSCVALRGLTTSLSITQLSRRGGRAEVQFLETCSSVDGESGSSNIERFIHVISVFVPTKFATNQLTCSFYPRCLSAIARPLVR